MENRFMPLLNGNRRITHCCGFPDVIRVRYKVPELADNVDRPRFQDVQSFELKGRGLGASDLEAPDYSVINKPITTKRYNLMSCVFERNSIRDTSEIHTYTAGGLPIQPVTQWKGGWDKKIGDSNTECFLFYVRSSELLGHPVEVPYLADIQVPPEILQAMNDEAEWIAYPALRRPAPAPTAPRATADVENTEQAMNANMHTCTSVPVPAPVPVLVPVPVPAPAGGVPIGTAVDIQGQRQSRRHQATSSNQTGSNELEMSQVWSILFSELAPELSPTAVAPREGQTAPAQGSAGSRNDANRGNQRGRGQQGYHGHNSRSREQRRDRRRGEDFWRPPRHE
ncbi:hypothetical protein F4802DRAFT_542075 [Xylaria palmicola]|nr:hypothetical protein F4802DRAFT_542075 [Xylaria palmicola]